MANIGIKAELVKNEIGAFYDDAVWDRWLEIKLNNGDTINRVFDPEALSTDLNVGQQYTFLLFPLVSDKTFSLDETAYTPNLNYQGIVRLTSWKPDIQGYDLYSHSLLYYRSSEELREWIVVEFSFGDTILSRRGIDKDGSSIEYGTKIYVSKDVRWDLYAVSFQRADV
jgi:hypothetical protein